MTGHYIVTGDGGMGIFGSPLNPTGNTAVSLPIGQMYRVTVDQRTPYWVYSARQDDGSMRIASDRPIVPANVPSYAPPPAPAGEGGGRGGRGGGFGGGGRGGAPAGLPQESMPSCESGYTYPEPGNHHFVWGTCYAAHVATFDDITGVRRSVSPWQHTLDSDPVGLKYRCQWSPPLAISWFDNSVYFGCQLILRTTNRGQTWTEYSPDLSTRDPSRIRFSGGVVGDNLGQFYGAVISAIAPSRMQPGVIWAGTNDGKVWITRDDGRNWTDLTANVAMPPWGIVRRIDASRFDPGMAYMAVDYHLMDQRDPYLYRTADFGRTWTRIDGGLPRGHPLDYALAIAESPRRRGMLYAGTGHAFFYSRDDGATWTPFKDRLPAAPVTWIEVPENAAEVAVATYGRGIYILRDAWQLEQGDLVDPQAGLQLYRPVPGVRGATGGSAEFVFGLSAAPSAPITVEVLGRNGAVLNTTQVQGRAGLNRTSWNLTLPGQNPPILRSLPPDNPHIWEEGRWLAPDGRPARERPVSHWGLASGFRPIATPGTYTVRMTYGGRQYAQPFEVRKDAALNIPDADLVAATEMQTRVVAAINDVVDRINRIEIMRQQVEDLRAQHGRDRSLDRALAAIGQQMYETELHYLSRTEMHSDDKWYVEKYRLYMNLVWLAAEIGSGGGDVAGGLGSRPTDAAVAVFADRQREMQAAERDFEKLLRDVEAFNRTHAGRLPALTDRLVRTTTD